MSRSGLNLRRSGGLGLPEMGPSFSGISSTEQLTRLAIDLGALDYGGPLSEDEEELVRRAFLLPRLNPTLIQDMRLCIKEGKDPLGELLCTMRSLDSRRILGMFYTPDSIARVMVDWVIQQQPTRIIDAGSGSGRFLVQVLRLNPRAEIVAIDIDPIATLLTRACLAAFGRGGTVIHADYTKVALPEHRGKSAFISNPPYVRHHRLPPAAKKSAVLQARNLGYKVSGLAGLHVYFFLATARHAKTGDVGCFVTSAEWLDVSYGAFVRKLLLNDLGGRSVHLVEPKSAPFSDAMATAAITCFEIGHLTDSIKMGYAETADSLADLQGGSSIKLQALSAVNRWSAFAKFGICPSEISGQKLGDFAKVHRGVATGGNRFFVLTKQQAELFGLTRWCRPVISGAEEIITADGVIQDSPSRKMLLTIPKDTYRAEYPELDEYLRQGEQPDKAGLSIANSYLPSHRRPWWHLGEVQSPPIVASYMARRPPVFAANPEGLAILNIAHGIYPYASLGSSQVTTLVTYLNDHRETFRGKGRTYQGGLEKFEPTEMEALAVPGLVLA